MSTKARVRLIYLLGGLALLIVMAVSAFLLASVASNAARVTEEPATVVKVIVVTATPSSGPTVTFEARVIGVDFASPEDVTALYNRGGEIEVVGVAGDVVYYQGKLYQVYHNAPNTGEFFFPEGEVVTVTLAPVFPTTPLPDPFPSSLRIQPQ